MVKNKMPCSSFIVYIVSCVETAPYKRVEDMSKGVIVYDSFEKI